MSRSLAVPLMKRTVCRGCGHLHRRILGTPQRDSKGRLQPVKCECCKADVLQQEQLQQEAAR